MPTNRKTALSIVCFYALFFITSCANPKKNKVTFQNQDQENKAEVTVLDRSETTLRIQLTCLSKAKDIAIRNVELVCLNVNSMGINAIESADSEDLLQVYDAKYKGNRIRVILPYGNLEKHQRSAVLRVVAPNRSRLEMKLFTATTTSRNSPTE